MFVKFRQTILGFDEFSSLIRLLHQAQSILGDLLVNRGISRGGRASSGTVWVAVEEWIESGSGVACSRGLWKAMASGWKDYSKVIHG
jgi:hypothetical protein